MGTRIYALAHDNGGAPARPTRFQPAACGCISRNSSAASHRPAALCGIPSVTSPAHRILLYANIASARIIVKRAENHSRRELTYPPYGDIIKKAKGDDDNEQKKSIDFIGNLSVMPGSLFRTQRKFSSRRDEFHAVPRADVRRRNFSAPQLFSRPQIIPRP